MYSPDGEGNIYRFQNRYRVTGTLTCEGPLHVGDGETLWFVERADRLGKEISDETREAQPEYATTSTGEDHRPILPGTAVKGVLRHWLEGHGIPKAAVERVFGAMTGGGKAVFLDGQLRASPQVEPGFRWWDPERRTCLTPQVVIDPRTRAAAEGLVFYTEFVPAGTVFDLEICGQDWSEEDRDLVLFALRSAFSPTNERARLGTGQSGDWGRVCWEPEDVKVLGAAELKAWMDSPVRHYSMAFPPQRADVQRLEQAALARWQAAPGPETVRIEVVLRFDGAFLVNDPSQTRKRDEARNIEGISHATIRQVDQRYCLPESSVRGALRAQARRIWQTCAWQRGGDLNGVPKNRKEARRASDLGCMAPFYRMWGASGWRSPIEIEDFELVGAAKEHPQEFVAIDRFTGGAAEERKFNARGLYAPVFRGGLVVRVDRAKAAGVEGWGWLCLAFLLRDWMEGDITFGFGAARGYGACTASIEVDGQCAEAVLLAGLLRRESASLNDPRVAEWERQWNECINREVAA